MQGAGTQQGHGDEGKNRFLHVKPPGKWFHIPWKTGYPMDLKAMKIQEKPGKGKAFHNGRQKRPFIDGPC